MPKQIGKEFQQNFYQSINESIDKIVEIKNSIDGFKRRLDTLNMLLDT